MASQEWREKERQYGKTIKEFTGQVFFRYGKVVLPFRQVKSSRNGVEYKRKIIICTLYDKVRDELNELIEGYKEIAKAENLQIDIIPSTKGMPFTIITLSKKPNKCKHH